MFLKIRQLAKEIEMILLKLLCDLMDGMPVVAPLQSESNQKLVTLNGCIQALNQAINRVKVVVKDISTLCYCIKLCHMDHLLLSYLGGERGE